MRAQCILVTLSPSEEVQVDDPDLNDPSPANFSIMEEGQWK